MRVCLLNDSFPPQIDGVANAVFNYAAYSQKNHGSAVVLTPSYPRAWDAYDFDVIRYPSLPVERLLGFRAGIPTDVRTHYQVSQNPPDLIHSHCPFVSSMLARGLKEELHVPLVFTYHTKFDQDLSRVLHNPPLEAIVTRIIVDNIQASDEVWTVSEGAKENLCSLGYQGSIRVMPNGVDFPLGNTRGKRTDALRGKLCVPGDVPVFLFVGRMFWYKGQRLILDSLKLLAQRGCDFRMIFVGEGNHRPEMEAYAKELGLSERCLFVGAVHDRELLRDYFSLADLMLFPSEYDTNGIVVREAAACALGSLLVEGSCAAEGILDGEAGLLCRSDAGDMAERLYRALQEPGMLRKIGEQAQKELYLSWEDAVALAHRRYEVILEDYRSGKLQSPRLLTSGVYALNAEMQNRLNRLIHAEESVQKRIHAIRRHTAWRILREQHKANFRVRRIEGHLHRVHHQIKDRADTTYRRLRALPRKIWEDIERYR